jgi:hypothetical protein
MNDIFYTTVREAAQMAGSKSQTIKGMAKAIYNQPMK